MIVSQTRIGSVARKEEEMGKSNRIKPRSKKKIYQNLNFFCRRQNIFCAKMASFECTFTTPPVFEAPSLVLVIGPRQVMR